MRAVLGRKERRTAGRLAAVVSSLFVLGWAATGFAAAHATVVSVAPAYGTTVVSGEKGDVTIHFDEAVTVADTGLAVLDRDGNRVETPRPTYRDSDHTIATTLPAALPDGTYLISWAILSADGHTVGGSSVFGLGVPPDTTLSKPTPDPLRGALDTMTRLLHALTYLGVVAAVGLPLVVAWCSARRSHAPHDGSGVHAAAVGQRRAVRLSTTGRPPLPPTESRIVRAGHVAVAAPRFLSLIATRRGAEPSRPTLRASPAQGASGEVGAATGSLARVGASTVAITSLAVLLLLPARLGGAASWVESASWTAAFTSNAGIAALLGLTGAAVTLLARPVVLETSAITPRNLAWRAGAALTVLGTALAGHASAASDFGLTLVSATVHVTAMALWGGGLLAVVAIWRGPERASALRQFTPIAVGAVIALAITGTIQAVPAITPLDALWTTAWGQLLLAKLALVAVTLALAAVLRHRARRSEYPGRLLIAETATLSVIVLLSALLAGAVPARDAYDPPLHATLNLGDAQADVTVDGMAAGDQTVAVHVRRDDAPIEIRSLTGKLAKEDDTLPQNLDFRRVTPKDRGPDYFVADLRAARGDWRLALTVTFDQTTAYAASTPYRVW
ncbi:copper resistance CopC/CopD family protein [Nocardia camponoti]|uniref:Copper resistance protein CopC n=1 Tax=Nocardia camponoti TaxID=1616106 RepID=A0A917Q7U9_9NOCA|nr:copper resistance protein CopC [Nocardia camponoti]GGK34117.1 hypothetical protein GCM10011591_02280 [Nocardia camponoti]